MKRVSTSEQRNTELFDQIADVLEFTPKRYNQKVWGKFRTTHKNGNTRIGVAKEWKKFFGLDSEVGDEDDSRWLKVQTCDTAMCIAGHAANLSGYHPTLSYKDHPEISWHQVNPKPMQLWRAEGTRNIESFAAERLGITNDEAEHLFEADAKVTSGILREIGRGGDIFKVKHRS